MGSLVQILDGLRAVPLFSLYTTRIPPDCSGLHVLLAQMVSTTGTALGDDFMTQSHYQWPAKLQVGRGRWLELCQVMKGGKYGKCHNLRAVPAIRGVHVTKSPIANVFCGAYQVALLQNSSTFSELS